jgi:O-antigen ligase
MNYVLALYDLVFGLLEAVPVEAALAGLCVALVVPLLSDRVFALLVVVLYTVPLSHYAPGGLNDAVRGLVLLVGLIRMLATQRFGNLELSAALGGWRRLLIAGTLLVLVSTVWSQSPMESLAAGVGLLALVVLLWSASPDGVTARWAVETVLWWMIGLSVLVAPLAESWLAGRFRGVMANPNGLAAFLVVAGLLSLEARRLPLARAALCGVLLFLTGSRSGALAFVVGLAVVAFVEWRRRHVTAKGLALTTAFVGALTVVFLTVPFERLPWRTRDTRSDVWATSFGLVQDHAVLGLGGGAFPSESGNSYLRLLAELGVVGTAICVFALVSTMRLRSYSAPQVAVLAAMAVHMVFEGWFLVGGSAIFLALVATTATGSRRRSPAPAEPAPPPPVLAGRRSR